MLKEFKDFISRGNVMDLAIAVIIGGAFTAIVNSLVTNLINPLIGLLIGKVDLSDLMLTIGGATFKYGSFLNAIINFIIIAFVVFLLMKAVTKVIPMKPKVTGPSKEETYLKEIRDLLQAQQTNNTPSENTNSN